MAVTSVGTPANTHSATGSVTGTWAGNQPRTAGNLLVAVVSAAATTSVTIITTVTAGWTQVIPAMNRSDTVSAPVVRAAMWVKPATGADAVPVFTSTEAGTAGGMDCMLFELAGATVVTASGIYASGNAAGTLSAMLVASAGVCAAPGGYAISCFAQQAAAASLTFTGTGGFTRLLNGNGATSVLQTYVGVFPNSPVGTVETDGGAFSVNTSAFGAGLIALFTAGPASGRTAYLDSCAGTVAAGAGAPAAGTVESWTVNVTGAFPIAKPGVSGGAFPLAVAGVIGFDVVDPAAPTEKIHVSVAPGGTGGAQAWTVTRGADGSTPVTHAAGFSVTEAVTAAQLGNLAPMRVVTSPRYGAYGDGSADDTAAIQAALNDAAAEGGGDVYVPSGTFVVTNLTIDSYVTLRGSGRASVLAAKAGTASGSYMISLTNPANSRQTVIRDITLWPNISGVGGINLDNTGYGLASDPLHQLTDVYVWQAGGDAYHLDNNQRALRVLNCIQYGAAGHGFYLGRGLLSGGAGCTDGFFSNCVSGSSGGHGFFLDGGWNCMFATCKGFFSGWNGSVFDTTHCAFEISNGVNNTAFVGCSAQNGALHGFDLNGCAYVTLSGCQADSNASGATATGVGIEINGAVNCVVAGCVGQTVAGNNQLYGIQVDGTNTGTWILGNTIAGLTGAFHYGSGGGYVLVSGNTVDLSGMTQIKLLSGTILPSAALGSVVAGAIENDGTAFYATAAASSRQVIDAGQFTSLTATRTLTNNAVAQAIFNATANGAITVAALTSYYFECEFDLTGLSASAHTLSFGFGGTATFTSARWRAETSTGAAGTPVAWLTSVFNVATASVITASATTTTAQARIRGILRVNGAGTLIPQVTQTTNTAAAIVGVNSWFRLNPVGSNTVTSVGNWS